MDPPVHRFINTVSFTQDTDLSVQFKKNRPSGHFPHFLTVCLSVSVMIYMSSPKVNVKLLINCVIC